MKKFLQNLMLLAAFVLPLAMQAQTVIVGTGTSTSYSPSPFCNYYNNGMSQMVYPASEIGASGAIDTIWFYHTGTASVASTTLKIYLATTSSSTLSGFLPASDFEEVYTATGVSLGGSVGWQPFVLTTPFYYDGADNLVVCCTRQSSSYSSSVSWAYTSMNNSIVYRQNDSDASYGDITSTATGSVSNYRFNIKLHIDSTATGPTCPHVSNVVANNIVADGATIHWTETGDATTWLVVLNSTEDTTNNGTSFEIYEDSIELTNLMANTNYQAVVYALCSGSDTSAPRFVNFRTPCVAVAYSELPYSYGFEDATSTSSTGTINPCWYKGITNYSTPYPYPTTTAHSGTRGLYFYGYYTSNYFSWVALPQFDAQLDSLMISFWFKPSSATTYYAHSVDVGVMSDPNDWSTFRALANVHDDGNVWTLAEVPLSQFAGLSGHLAIAPHMNSSEYYGYMYLDDITVDYIPDCFHVSDFNIAGVTPNSALVTWTPSNPDGSSLVQVKADTAADWTSYVATGGAYAITGLVPTTDYQVRVASLCTNGDTSDFRTGAFTTTQFDCAEMDSTNLVSATVGNGTTTNSYFPTYSFYNYSVSQAIYRASEIQSDSGNITAIRFQLGSFANLRDYDIYLTNVADSTLSAFVPVSASDLVWSGNTANFVQNGWTEIALTNAFRYTGGNILVTFDDNTGSYTSGNTGVGHSSISNCSRYIYQDGSDYVPTSTISGGTASNFRLNMTFFGGTCLQLASCAAPVVATSRVTADTVELVWAPGGDETDWDVLYRRGNTGAFTFVDNTSTPNFTFENLSPATSYTFRVQHICDGDTFATDVTCMTECAAISNLPYTEDFESYATGSNSAFHPCWAKFSDYSTGYPYVNTLNNDKCMYFYSYSSYVTYLQMPEFVDSVNSLELSFDAYCASTGYGHILVGLTDNMNEVTTFDTVAVIDITQLSTWNNYVVSLNNYHGTGKHITFLCREGILGNQYASFYIDNIVVDRYSTCPRVEYVRGRDITATSAQVTWNASDEHESFMLYWSTANNIDVADSAAITDGNTYDMNNLNANTTYYLWVRASCTDEDSRIVSGQFTTGNECNPVVNLTVGEVTTTTASITWSSDETTDATQYRVMWMETSATSPSWNTLNTSNTYLQLSGLTMGSTYQVKVTAICNTDSASAQSVTFTTPSDGVIGGGEGTDSPFPFYPYYSYSISEEMWTPTELATYGDTVYGIYFNAVTSFSGRDVQLWVGNTSLQNLSTTSYVPSDSLTLVFDSTFSANAGWYLIPFDTPFVRDLNKNFVVMATDVSGDWDDFSGHVYGASTITTLYDYNDDAAYSTTNLSGLQTYSGRAQMRLQASLVTPDCYSPHPVVASSTSTSVDLVWMAGNNETSWSVDYRLLSDTAWTTAYASVADTHATVTNLEPSTGYAFRVTSICGNSTAAATIIGSTSCGTFSVPYTENFNSYPNNDYTMNSCWKKGSVGTSGNPYTVNITGQGPMMCMPLGSYVIFPAMDEDVSALQMRFSYAVADTSIWALVGVCNHPNDIYSMRIMDTVRAITAGEVITRTIPFSSYDDTAAYICIFSPFNQSYFDDINIDYIPMCNMVDSVQVLNITPTTADVTWVATNANSTSYIVEYGPAGFALGQGTRVAAATTGITLTGLSHSTSYQVYVYSVCSLLNDTSYQSNVKGFTTECAPFALPYTMNFDLPNIPALDYTGILPNCWTYEMLATGSYAMGTYLPQIYTSSSYASSGSYSLRLCGRGIVALPEMGTSVDSLQITFHEYNSSPSYYALVVGVVDSVTPGFAASFVPVDTIISSNTTGNYTVYLASYQGTGRHIAFYNYYVNSTVDYSYHFIDDVVVDYMPSCLPPQGIHSTGNTATSIDLAWTDLRPATQWEVAYSTSSTNPGAGTVVSTNPCTISGLGDSNYYFWVRTICSTTDQSTWAGPFMARPGTWTMRTNMVDTVYMCGGHIYDDGGPDGAYTNSQTNTMLIVYPETPLNLVEISGIYFGEGCCDYLEIYDGVGTNGTQFCSLLGNGSNTSSVTVGPYQSTTGPITILFTSDGSVSYNGYDLTVNCISNSCPRPTNIHAAEGTGTTTIVLDWDDDPATNPIAWDVEYGNRGFAQGSGTVVNTTSHPVTLTGLTASTNYDVYVRPICSANDTGDWRHEIVATAMCESPAYAYNYDSTSSFTTATYSPAYAFYNYSFSQNIIDSAYLAQAGGTDFVAFSFKPNTTTAGTYYTNCEVYLRPYAQSTISSAVDMDSLAVKVFDGDLSFTTTDWQTFLFDTSYTWDGSSNLLLTIVRKHGTYLSGCGFEGVSATGKCYAGYSDSYIPNASSLTSWSGSTTSSAAAAKFMLTACGAGHVCHTPVISNVATTYNTATVTFSGDAGTYEIAVKEAASAVWPAETSISAFTHTFTGLTPETDYTFRIRQDCDSNGYSDWVIGNFTTDELPCFAPENLVASNIEGFSAQLAWTGHAETSWEVAVFNTTYSNNVTVTANPTTVTLPAAGTQYFAAVRALCGDGTVESDWSDTISFTTDICDPVTNVAATVNGTSATITFSAGENNNGQWEIEYGLSGFSQGEGTMVQVTNTSATINNLYDETSYDAYVRAICGSNYVSTWSNKVTFTTEHIGISHVDGGMNVSIYPNPATGATTISLSGVDGIVNIAIVDMNGRTILTDAMECQGDCVKKMNVDNLAQGAYFVRIYSDSVNTVKKLIVR